ncbi:MAG: acetoacetate decarboxylase family protein [Burkholderiaceae bacterium]
MTKPDGQLRFRMPMVFGPSAGPRQGPDGRPFDMREAARTTTTVSFLTDARRLIALLPPGCTLDGEPVVTVEHCVLHRLEWLAGRSYTLLAVKFPVSYRGVKDAVRGPFMSVLWENRVEPILTGREELGYPKLFCELPGARELHGVREFDAMLDGHIFIRLRVANLIAAEPPTEAKADGLLLHRYLPGLEPGGAAAVDEMVLSPFTTNITRYTAFWRGTGSVEFIHSRWEQLPTSFHIVNALADLPVIEPRGATLAETLGAKDLADTRLLA